MDAFCDKSQIVCCPVGFHGNVGQVIPHIESYLNVIFAEIKPQYSIGTVTCVLIHDRNNALSAVLRTQGSRYYDDNSRFCIYYLLICKAKPCFCCRRSAPPRGPHPNKQRRQWTLGNEPKSTTSPERRWTYLLVRLKKGRRTYYKPVH